MAEMNQAVSKYCTKYRPSHRAQTFKPLLADAHKQQAIGTIGLT